MDRKCFYESSVVITKDNVKEIGETIAVKALKIVSMHSNGCLDHMYKLLIQDVYDAKSVSDNYSDGYDIAMSVICFLCEHTGKQLGCVIGKDKRGIDVNVWQKGIRIAYREIYKLRSNIYNTAEYNTVPKNKEPSYELPDKTETDYSKVDNIIEKMKLSTKLTDTLNCCMAGMRYVQIARFLNTTYSTVWRRRIKLQEHYNRVQMYN